ncbi:unnamed protein product [Orchesella dallaii]|uniref:Uncharacterized protein n=1 Tax=Orchesella dallaii TaxID=48710 RepID=A0ABP1QLE5_9HEXA
MNILASTKAKSVKGEDQDNGHTTIEIARGEALERHSRFNISLILSLIITFYWLSTQIFVTSPIDGGSTNETVTTNGDHKNAATTEHANNFPIANFQPAGKPDKEFWISLKPTIEIDRTKPYDDGCRDKNGRVYCRTPFHGEVAEDNQNCIIYTFISDESNQNQSDTFEFEMELLNNTTCNVVAVRNMPVETLPPIQQRNARFTIINGESDEGSKAVMEDKYFGLIMAAEIFWVDENSIADVESKIGLDTRMIMLKFKFELKRMVEGVAQRVLNIFEQVQRKGFRLAKTNSSCSKVDNGDCVVEYYFLNANYLWEYISVPNNDKREEAQ